MGIIQDSHLPGSNLVPGDYHSSKGLLVSDFDISNATIKSKKECRILTLSICISY